MSDLDFYVTHFLQFFLMYWGVSLICENGQIASPYRVPSNAAVMESIRRYAPENFP